MIHLFQTVPETLVLETYFRDMGLAVRTRLDAVILHVDLWLNID